MHLRGSEVRAVRPEVYTNNVKKFSFDSTDKHEPNWLMCMREIIAVYWGKYAKHINALRGKMQCSLIPKR